MERRSHRQFFGVALAWLALAGFVGSAYANDFDSWDQVIDNASKRFTVLKGFNNAAVLDNETGLVWEQSPGDTNGDTVVDVNDEVTWAIAGFHCVNKNVGGRKGWRLPSFEELASLIDPNAASAPFFPAGHPFTNVQSSRYWSATSIAGVPPNAWNVDFNDGFVFTNIKTNTVFVWCVRGDGPLSEY